MDKVLFKDLSYDITGLCFQVHRELGRYCKEKQYCDRFEELLIERDLPYKREYRIDSIQKGNQWDFLIRGEIVVEFKANDFIKKTDYFQVQRYLHALKLELGIIYNFRNYRLAPKRILNSKHKGWVNLTEDEKELITSLGLD